MMGFPSTSNRSAWFKSYRLDHLKLDLFSGLTVALVLIPQSMAYAQLAGLPSYYGLYASVFPPAIAALLGSSRQLATGPVAVVSLMTAVALKPLATAGSEYYIAYAVLLSLMVGVFQFSIGILRVGMVVNLLSHPVINGFTNAAAVIIASAQLPKLLGVYVDRGGQHYETIFRVIKAANHYIHWPTVILGVAAFVIMYALKKTAPKIPNVLVAVLVTTTVSWAIGFEDNFRVPIDRIHISEARMMVERFNQEMLGLVQLKERRSSLNKFLEAAMERGDTAKAIQFQRDLSLAKWKLEKKEKRLASYRATIRTLKLEAVKNSDGEVLFYSFGKLPHNVHGDGHIWRIRIGNQPLKIQELMLAKGGDVVGNIPRGLPDLRVPHIDLSIAWNLLPYAVTIALLGFMEAISIAKAMAAKTGQRIDPNRELIGQGLANICGAFGQSYPTAGSFSRSALNLQAGAVSGLSAVFSSLMVIIALFWLTPLLYHLPQSVLAAIIMMAVASLINIRGFVHAWRAKWYDGAISIITFGGTLVFAPHLERGIFLGVALSLLVFLYKNMRPVVVDLSLGRDMALHDAVSYGLQECLYIDVVRFDGPLFFANASYLEEQIRLRRQNKRHLKHIILAAESISDIDASGEEVLSLSVDRLRSAGIDISLSGVNESVMALLERTHLLAKIGEDHTFPSIKRAVNTIHRQTHRGGKEKDCPLTSVCRINKAMNI
jgi:MFS superfamily sulfate permease-like transporter